MKQQKKHANPVLAPLYKKVSSTKKASEKAFAGYEKHLAGCEDAECKKLDKLATFEMIAALKIAKFTWKIKKTEYKLAKNALKLAEKTGKKIKEAPDAAAGAITKLKKATESSRKSAKLKSGEGVSDSHKVIAKNKKGAGVQ